MGLSAGVQALGMNDLYITKPILTQSLRSNHLRTWTSTILLALSSDAPRGCKAGEPRTKFVGIPVVLFAEAFSPRTGCGSKTSLLEASHMCCHINLPRNLLRPELQRELSPTGHLLPAMHPKESQAGGLEEPNTSRTPEVRAAMARGIV